MRKQFLLQFYNPLYLLIELNVKWNKAITLKVVSSSK
jgi:hypothetical protein